MKRRKMLVMVMLGFILAGFLYVRGRLGEDKHTHYHAGFKVYIDGELQDYRGFQYMNYTPCTEHDEKKSLAEEQIEKAHLHDSVGDVVHVHRAGATWGDLFRNIKANLVTDKEITGYVNGEKIEDIMNAPIAADSTVVVVVGTSRVDHSRETVPIEHIKEVEAKSELCGN